jgi:sugar/nucleoside kinase (ribokinase family)
MAALLDHVDLVFGNEQEARGMTDAADVDAAVAELAKRCSTVAVTLGAAGSIAAADGRRCGCRPSRLRTSSTRLALAAKAGLLGSYSWLRPRARIA